MAAPGTDAIIGLGPALIAQSTWINPGQFFTYVLAVLTISVISAVVAALITTLVLKREMHHHGVRLTGLDEARRDADARLSKVELRCAGRKGELVTKDEMVKVQADMGDSYTRIFDALADMDLRSEARSKGVHDRVNEAVSSLSELRGQFAQHMQEGSS